MNYVMVPVPEELAPQVMNYLSWRDNPYVRALRATGSERPDDGAPPVDDAGGDPIERTFAQLDPSNRRLMVVLARASLDGEQLTVPEAATRAGLSERELIGAATEVNNVLAAVGGPPFAVLVKALDESQSASFTWHNRVVLMANEVARAVTRLAELSAD